MKLFLASACLSSEGIIRCVHQDGGWVQLEHLISLIWCELFGGVIIRKGSKMRLLTVMGRRALCWLQQPALPWSDGNCLILFRCIDHWGACAFFLPLFFYSLEMTGCSEVGSLLLIKTHRTYICVYIFVFKPQGNLWPVHMTCPVIQAQRSSLVLPGGQCSFIAADLNELIALKRKQKGSCGSGVTNSVRWELSARANVDLGEGLTLPFCFPCSDQVNYKCTAYLREQYAYTCFLAMKEIPNFKQVSCNRRVPRERVQLQVSLRWAFSLLCLGHQLFKCLIRK